MELLSKVINRVLGLDVPPEMAGLIGGILAFVIGVALLQVTVRFLLAYVSGVNSNRAVMKDVNEEIGDALTQYAGLEPKISYQQPSRVRPAAIHLSARSAGNVEFIIGRENEGDRIAKGIGLSREIQTGDMAFDSAYYVRTDDEDAVALFLQDPKVRQAITAIFDAGFKSVEVSAGKITAKQKPYNKNARTHLDKVFEPLQWLSQKCPQSTNRDVAVQRQQLEQIYLGVALFALLAGLLLNYRCGRYIFPEHSRIFSAGVKAMIFPGALFMGSAYFALRGRSNSHRVLVFIFCILVYVTPFFGDGLLRYLNCEWDRSPRQVVETQVAAKVEEGTRRHRQLYLQMTAPIWRDSGDLRLAVPVRVFDQFQTGQKVRVITRHGHLGFDWVESIQALDSERRPV